MGHHHEKTFAVYRRDVFDCRCRRLQRFGSRRFKVAVLVLRAGLVLVAVFVALLTATPIKHLVIIYDENVSFDHYFATYPMAANPTGEPVFKANPHTPTVNNLVTANLLTNNPNFTNTANGVMRPSRSAWTARKRPRLTRTIPIPPSSRPRTTARLICSPNILVRAPLAAPVRLAPRAR